MTNEANNCAASGRTSGCKLLRSLVALTVMFSWILLVPASAQFAVVYTFPIVSSHYVNGGSPQSNLVEVTPGVFLTTATKWGGTGTTCPGAPGLNGCGTIIKIDTTVSPATGTVVHQFTGTDGATPTGQLTVATDGNIYGVTQNGGVSATCPPSSPSGCGTVYRIGPDGSGFLVVHNFGGLGASPKDGHTPTAGIIQGADGNLYGTTASGGDTLNKGIIFVIAPPFDASAPYTAYAFADGPSGGGLPQLPVQATDGNLYGLASSAATKIVYSFTPMSPGPPIVALHTLDVGIGGLVQAADGALYGVSRNGGSHSMGTLFRATVAPPAATTLYTFAGGTADGAFPQAALYLAGDGLFYGTTLGGGNPVCAGCGSVFNLLPGTSGKMSLLHFFTTGEGGYPEAQLTEGSDGLLYGTAYGFGNPGTVFRLTKSSLPLWNLQRGTIGFWDGASSVVADAGGKVYVAGTAGTLFDPLGTGSFYIARFTKDGVLDGTFNGSGFVQFGPGLSSDYLARIRVDASGNIYVAGYTSGVLFPGLTNKGGQDGWVAKFAPTTTGKPVWAYMFGTSEDDLVYDFALDAAGQINLSGATKGNLQGSLTGVQDAFVAVVRVRHQHVTGFVAYQWGAPGETRRASRIAYCNSVSPPQVYAAGFDDASGNAWLSRFKPVLGITSGPLTTQTIAGGAGPGFFEAHGLGTDGACNVYLGGHTISHPLPSITDEHFFLNKYDHLLHGKTWEVDGPLNSGDTPAPEDFIYDLYVDPANRIFLGGSTSSPDIFGNVNNGETAPWYAAYDGTGKRLRSGTVEFLPGPSVVTEGNGIFANANGIYMVGNTNGNVAGPPDPAFSDFYLYAFGPLP